ncbi:hypothetical protein FQZ97_1209080 [compost metagenome]
MWSWWAAVDQLNALQSSRMARDWTPLTVLTVGQRAKRLCSFSGFFPRTGATAHLGLMREPISDCQRVSMFSMVFSRTKKSSSTFR